MLKYYRYEIPDTTAAQSFVNACEERFTASLEKAAEAALGRTSLRFIALAGPTCSGKTTTAGLLIRRLKEAGRQVKIVSIDDFFLDRAHLVAEAERSGEPIDLDSVKAIDLEELREFVDGIEELSPLRMPSFDFATGKRGGYTELIPSEQDIFLFEGIQAVYPEVVALFEPAHLLRIYISVENGIETPFGSWQPRQLRLMRRIVRDSRIRNTDAETTMAHWGGVTENELRNIEPYRSDCDILLDSGMGYEPSVLKTPLLAELGRIGKDAPCRVQAEEMAEQLRLLPVIGEDLVPPDSVLREFIG